MGPPLDQHAAGVKLLSSLTCTNIDAASVGTAKEQGVTLIKPRPGLKALDLPALWQFRDLWWALLLRDVQVRYKQTMLGGLWAVLQPVAMMIVATLVLGKLLGLDQRVDGAYPVFVYAGLIPWTLFSATVAASTNSLVANAEMLRKVYFPRLILPLAAIGAPVVDFAASFTVLMLLVGWFAVGYSASLLLLPVVAMSVLIAALGVGVLLSALTVSYRDFRLVVPFLLQLWFFLTPVVYPLPLPAQWAWLANLNPIHGSIEAFRAVILHHPVDLAGWACSTVVATACLLVGLIQFSRAEQRFADVV